MFDVDVSPRRLAALVAGAAALNSIAAEHADELAKIPKDQIKQWEIAVLYHVYAAQSQIELGFRRRLEAGAAVEPGEYLLDLSPSSVEEVEETAGLVNFASEAFDCVSRKPRETEAAARAVDPIPEQNEGGGHN
jgi:hypothetical protein